ncbi:MAG TPA: hypothetical protein VFG46_28520, partial [Chryseolinea sp.]|nr:hypothetical protein [Chryseolinea sp.]
DGSRIFNWSYFRFRSGRRATEKEEAKVDVLPFLILPVTNSRFFSLYSDPNEDVDREYTLWKNAQLRTNFSWLE